MKARTALLYLVVLTTSGYAQGDEHLDIGPLRIGMSGAEALSITGYGVPYKNPGKTDVFTLTKSLTFVQKEGHLTFHLVNDKVDRLVFHFAVPGGAQEYREVATRFAGGVGGLLQAGDKEKFIEISGKCVEDICDNGSTAEVARNAANPKIELWFRTNNSGTYTCQLVVNSGPPSTSTDSVPTSSEPSRPASTTASSYVVNGEEGRKFNRSLGTIHALLVRPLDDGKNAASAMKLTVTAIAERTDGSAEVSFNQEVGEDMKRANQEVARAVMLRNGSFPANTNVRFGFADKWGGKDGPSAAVACAILLESLFHGFEIPSVLAVTGDLNADSTVQPVGGVADKIRGAMGAGCNLIGIPAANEEDITDLVVEESLRRFLIAKVFTLAHLDKALALADPSRMTEAGREAMSELDAVQKELTAQGAAIYSPEMQQRLVSIQTALPNCYTAKILAAAGRRTLPARYSLVGTLMRIDEAMTPYSTAMDKIKDGTPVEEFRLGRNDPIQETKNRLNSLRARSDERFVSVIDTQRSLIDQFQRLLNADVGSRSVLDTHIRELERAEERADEAWRKVKENREIQDQFMKRGIGL